MVLFIVFALGLVGLVIVVWLFAQMPVVRRHAADRCDRCGYLLTGLPSDATGRGPICPECGSTDRDRALIRSYPRRAIRSSLIVAVITSIVGAGAILAIVGTDPFLLSTSFGLLVLPGVAMQTGITCAASARLRPGEAALAAGWSGASVVLGASAAVAALYRIWPDPLNLVALFFWGVPWSLSLSAAGLGLGIAIAIAIRRTKPMTLP